MTLVKYNPASYRPSTLSSFVDRFFNDDFLSGKSTTSFSPKVDIAETDKEFEIQFHLPGMKKEDIRIDVQDDRLTVSGERKMESEKKEKNYHAIESYYGSFSRSFYLPDAANVEKVDATYKDGILTVAIPKDEKKTQQRTIAIK